VDVGPEEMMPALEGSVEEPVVASERLAVLSMDELVFLGVLVMVNAGVPEDAVV
jgi:hypothetical protein